MIGQKRKRTVKVLISILLCSVLLCLLTLVAAAAGDVAGAVEQTWESARGQIQQVVNRVVFPFIDLVLAVLFFVKIATAYLDYRKRGQFEWTGPAILLATLVFSLTCPLYIWQIIGF